MLYCFIILIQCLFKMFTMCLPTFITIVLIQAITYWLTGISLYNKFEKFLLIQIYK